MVTHIPYWPLFREFVRFAGTKGLKALLLVLFGAFVESVGLVLLVPLFSVVIDSQSARGWLEEKTQWLFVLFATDGRLAKLILLLTLFALVMFARAVILTVRDVTVMELQVGFIQQIRMRVTRELAAARWDTVCRVRHSRITQLIGSDIVQLGGAISLLLRDSIAILMLATQTVLAFLLAPLLAALALGAAVLSTALMLPMIRDARVIGASQINANLSLIDNVMQFLGALKLAISQSLQESFIREFEVTLNQTGALQIKYVRHQTITRQAVTTITGLVGAVAIALSILLFDISASVLMTLLFIFSRMSGPIMQLQLDAQHLANMLPAYEKIRELESELAGAEAATVTCPYEECVLPNNRIVFSGVSFQHYEAARPSSSAVGGVYGLNLIIEPASVIGITGPSGSGKTTFADLLVGLYQPQSGEIRVGDVPLRGSSVIAWQNSVSYVSQDPYLFHDSIRRNLLWAAPDADEEALWSALRITGADEVVRNTAHGLDTIVGERGSLLSGGERQRICLARAVLRRPRVLVLDEATSAIDIEGERSLFQRFLQITPLPTIIIIAHRLESLRHCQRVLCFAGGTIVSEDRGLRDDSPRTVRSHTQRV